MKFNYFVVLFGIVKVATTAMLFFFREKVRLSMCFSSVISLDTIRHRYMLNVDVPILTFLLDKPNKDFGDK